MNEGVINLRGKLSGKVIVLDGPDGCGKTTQTRLLVQWLSQQGVKTDSFRDPGDTAIGEKVRDILLSSEHKFMDTRAELLLYMAARAQLWSEKLAPALQQNKCVVLDRWLSSTCAYQGFAGGFGMDRIIKIARDSLVRVWPDLTIILDVDAKTGLSRLRRQFDRMEQKGHSYHKKVREGFLQLAKDQENFVVINTNEDIEQVHKKIVEEVTMFFSVRKAI
jgi:dTMP kinase